MKARIIGIVLVFIVLGALYVVTSDPPKNNRPVPSYTGQDSGSLKDLKIN